MVPDGLCGVGGRLRRNGVCSVCGTVPQQLCRLASVRHDPIRFIREDLGVHTLKGIGSWREPDDQLMRNGVVWGRM